MRGILTYYKAVCSAANVALFLISSGKNSKNESAAVQSRIQGKEYTKCHLTRLELPLK